ncbi:alpha/beta hydrolase [Kurthia massiliensis]|uniref:alpha/beta hydrolase n=1 Tax=Kurthia massiliensis TaxID=1033739 RepID=UPI000287FC17|nr:alpha/beta hydrolase [Kurthia massiliensis]
MWKWEADGQARGVAVVIHSAYEHHRRYAWLIEELRSRGFHVIAGDLPGHGEDSAHKRVHDESLKSYERYVKRMVDTAFEYHLPVFIFGHGMGAIFGLYAVQKYNYEVAGLILTSAWFHLRHQPSRMSNALPGFSKVAGALKIHHEVTTKQLTRSYDAYLEIKDDILYNSTVTVKWYNELHNFMKALQQSEKKLPNVPVLMMNGGMDKVVDVSYSKRWLIQQDLSEFIYKEWPKCHHDLYLEPERELMFDYVESFLFNSLKNIGYIVE